MMYYDRSVQPWLLALFEAGGPLDWLVPLARGACRRQRVGLALAR